MKAYNLPLGCISHAIRAQAGGLPGALSKVGLDIFVDPKIVLLDTPSRPEKCNHSRMPVDAIVASRTGRKK